MTEIELTLTIAGLILGTVFLVILLIRSRRDHSDPEA